MRRLWILVLVVALSTGACSSSAVEDEPPDTTETDTETTVPETAPTDEPTTTSEPPEASQGPTAPDFTLELATGETFRLSEEEDPVYLVFWAE